MNTKTFWVVCYFSLPSVVEIQAQEDKRVPFSWECEVLYTDGSLTQPCSFCALCVKDRRESDKSSYDYCYNYSFRYKRNIKPALFFVAKRPKYSSCTVTDFCPKKIFQIDEKEFNCACSQGQRCVEMFGTCKCLCEAGKFGQQCEYSVPKAISFQSIADLQNVVYPPFTYINDFTTISLYFYNTGANLQVEIQTESEILTFDSGSCDWDADPITKKCKDLFEGSKTYPYEKNCHGGPTYENHANNETCVINVHLAFPRDQPNEFTQDLFAMDYMDDPGNYLEKNIAAKLEAVTVVVKNSIPKIRDATIHFDKFGILVVYSGKNQFEDCLPFVKIPKLSNSMQHASSFYRKVSISVTNLIVLKDIPQCSNLGDPKVTWYVWKVGKNHDELKNVPFYQLAGKDTLLFEPFSLDFGIYKVKSEIKFVGRKFNRGIAYCYFKVVPIHLQPIIIGGSLRYIYYKTNLKLKTMTVNNPNFPEDQQPTTMKYTWYCNDKSTPLCDKDTTEKDTLIKYAPFIPEKQYTFFMETPNPSTLLTESTNQIIVVSTDPMPSLLIKCLKNCGGKGFKSDFREIFYFVVVHSEFSYDDNKNDIYSWTFAESNQTFQDVSDIRQLEVTPSSVLIVNENSLESNQKYTFEVVGGGEVPGKAQITIKTFKESKVFSCDINPKSGIAGLTPFHILCKDADFEDGDVSVLYYFYDKSSEEDITAKLLATTYIHTVENLVLTRGTVAIYATNTFGHFLETYVTVNLTTQIVTAELINKNIDLIENLSENEGYEQKISYISSLCDILNDNLPLKETTIEKFLEIINREEITDIVHAELCLSSTQSVICNKNECKEALKSDTSYKYLSEILRKISNKIADEIVLSANTVFSSLKINLLYSSLIKCMAVLLSANEEILNDKDFEVVDYKRFNLFKFGNLDALRSFEKVNRALAMVTLPYVKHWAVQTKFIETWMKTDNPSFFTLGTKGNYNGSYISLSSKLADSLETDSKLLNVQITKFDINPYWFSPADEATTEVTQVSLGAVDTYKTYKPVTQLRYPVDIFLKKKPVVQSSTFGTVAQPDPKEDPDTNDLSVAIHRLFPKKGESISIRFLRMKDEDSFRVLIMINARPDYDQMVDKGVLITKTDHFYSYKKAVRGDKDAVYIGIIPGPSIPVGNVLKYEYELEGLRCQIWHDYLWDTAGCSLGSETTEEFVHCRCNHLSSIAGFLNVPVNTIDPLKDYTLFLSIPDNPYVVVLILVILLVYIALMIWAIKRDKVDMLKRSILVLEDNISTDTYGYLVTVITGSKCYAGTSSSIGIILHGSDTSSRSHILQSSKRPTLQRSDDWFLIFTPKKLGIISSVQLWTNHQGPSPNWFCDTIYIHDLTEKKDYTFIIGKWFGITELGTRFESFARPVKFDKEGHFTEFTTTNIISGLREFHLWMSVFMHHPRSPILRAQRLSIAMVALITIFLASILFYDASMAEDEDLFEYNLSVRELMISIYSLIISIVATEIVYVLFKRSVKTKNYNLFKKDALAYGQESAQNTRLVVDSANKLKVSKKAEHNCSFYVKKAISGMRKHKFHPVQLSTQPGSNNMCDTFSKCFAWTICLSTIFVAAFFIVWIGLKLGKVKSLMWLTSIGMSFCEDFFLADPLKICLIAVIFGIIQTQVCDVFSYDPNIYKIRTKSNIKANLKRDNFIHRMRFQKVYKHIPLADQEILKGRLHTVRKWWAFVDMMDIVFSSIVMFLLVSQVLVKGYYQTNTTMNKHLLKTMNLNKNLIPSEEIQGIESFYTYLQEHILPEIYRTHWYNKDHLTSRQESSPETGWFGTLTNRLIGVPRLRQIRVVKENCTLPAVFENMPSIYCNIRFSKSTEDKDDYGTRWKDASWSDVLFTDSPWSYSSPEKSTSISMFSESRQLFHGGGYVVELLNSRRGSSSRVLKLEDLNWLDLRTRVVFLEITAYNVNEGIFSSVVLMTGHLSCSLVLSGGGTWSTIIYEQNVFLEALFFLYAVLCLFKLSMQMKTVGTYMFFHSFWTVYDGVFVVIGVVVFTLFRVYSKQALTFIHEFQTEGKDEHGNFQNMIFHLHLKRFLLGLLFIMAILRTLRLTKYGNTRIFIQLKNTLIYSWRGIVSVTLILMGFMFILQWMISYLINTFYPTGSSHLLLRKMEYPSIYRSSTSRENVKFIFIPCFISSLSVACIIAILIKNYTWAKSIGKKF